MICIGTVGLPFTVVSFGKGAESLIYWLSLIPVLFGGILAGDIMSNPPHSFWKYRSVRNIKSNEL